jgi:hypothetical protein
MIKVGNRLKHEDNIVIFYLRQSHGWKAAGDECRVCVCKSIADLYIAFIVQVQ